MSLVNPYIGIPKCQDCGWKLYTDLTNNCSCMGENTPERELKYKIAYNRARELQTMSDSNLQTPEPEVIKLFPDIPDPVPEEFPLTVDPILVQTPEASLRLSEVPEQADSTEDGLVNDDPDVSLEPPEPTALIPETCAPQFIDVGTLPWSKLPIAELSPQTWFAYEKTEVGCCIFDGNGRKLFYTEDEEIAAFAVKAMNVYVLAAMQTQTEV